jgi:CubicO group peptidase (beta-lactamase class C family)
MLMHDRESALNAYLNELPSAGVSGAVLVARGAEIQVARGVGLADRGAGRPNMPETLFDIGSIAKAITAIAIFRLAQAGRLMIEDPIGCYLAGVPEDKAAITVGQVLTHTAGLDNYHADDDFEPMSREEAVAASLDLPLRWPPGNREGYSNAGYALLGAIVAQVSGQSFQDYVAEQVLRPAGMDDTGWFHDPRWPAERYAHGYSDGQDGGTPNSWPITWALLGGGGMVSTVRDLYRLHLALRDEMLLSGATQAVMNTAPLGRWAAGWEAHQTPQGRLILKGGSSDLGFTGQVRRYPDADAAIIFLMNAFAPPHGNAIHITVGKELERLVFAQSASDHQPPTTNPDH